MYISLKQIINTACNYFQINSISEKLIPKSKSTHKETFCAFLYHILFSLIIQQNSSSIHGAFSCYIKDVIEDTSNT